MSAIGKEDQIKAIPPLLKPLGFKKRAGTWHRATADAIHVVNVQGSQWGPEYYVNVGTYLRALGTEISPPVFRCHVQSRIEPPDRPARDLVRECQEWFEQYGEVSMLIAHCQANSLPVATTGKARLWLGAA